MSLLQEVIKEMAVTGGGSIAGGRGRLFGQKPDNKFTMLRRIGYRPVSEILRLKENAATFDAADVISKLDAAEKRASVDQDTTTFGLEDDNGNIVKVYVRAEQADSFEKTLSAMLAGADSNQDEANTAAEIAEVLFSLRTKFDIVDVEWGSIQGDEEEEESFDFGGEAPADEAPADDETDGDEEMVADMGDETDAKTTLAAVIDMMKADAAAKQAEAEARKSEAEARTAELAASAAQSKVKQEEEILDMEAFNKAQSDADKEAKTLAKLAKYKHQSTDDSDAPVSDDEMGVEQEEEAMTMDKLTQLLLKHMAAN